MSDTPRFLVVKYIPDLLRREPRNVGVILFAEDALVARFAGESEEPTPGVDKRRLAPFAIADPHNYARMIDYVREQLLAREGVGADDVLAECERGLGSYAVEEGGEVWVGRPDQEPPELLLELFTRLVGEPPAREPSEEPALKDVCQAWVRHHRLSRATGFRSPWHEECPLDGRSARVLVSFGYKGPQRRAFLEKVSLPLSVESQVQRNVRSAAWAFEHLRRKYPEDAELFSLVLPPWEVQSEARAVLDSYLEWLRYYSQVIDVGSDQGRERLDQLGESIVREAGLEERPTPQQRLPHTAPEP